MKKTFSKQAFLVVMVIFLSPMWALAQTLHVFIVAETHDRSIGASKDYVRMQQYVDKIARMSGMTLNLQTFEKHRTSASELGGAINNLRVSSDDAVWFYFTGHGFNENGSNFTGFPLGNTKFTMDKVHGKLKAKNPRLLITMYDACNWRSTRVPQVISGRQDDAEKFSKLFKKSKGDIKVASNTAGYKKYSYGSPEYGGFFTSSFLNSMNEAMEEWGINRVTWKEIMKRTQEKTKHFARTRGKDQVPYYTINSREPDNGNSGGDYINTPEDGKGLNDNW